MSHEDADALDLIRTELRLELRRYERRVKLAAETAYKRLAAQAELEQDEDFSHLDAAKDAVREAKATWLGIGSPEERQAIEAA